jgi:hypothetical protein
MSGVQRRLQAFIGAAKSALVEVIDARRTAWVKVSSLIIGRRRLAA